MIFVWLLLLSGIALASEGDRSPIFRACIPQCNAFFTKTNNHPIEYSFSRPKDISWSLFLWNIEDECKYQCMHIVETKFGGTGNQYYGKWPFWRVWGMQELFSCIFSLANLVAHIVGYRRYCYVLKYPTFEHRLYFIFSCITWTSSFLFHARDTIFTEFFDYFFALTSIFYGLKIAIVRTLSIKSSRIRLILNILLPLGLLIHFTPMIRGGRFNYSWNMTVSITAGIIHNFLWIVWTLRNPMEYRNKILKFVFFITLASLLETIDFTPVFGLIDTHSLWHLSTVPLVILYWSFITEDTLFELSHVSSGKVKPTRVAAF